MNQINRSYEQLVSTGRVGITGRRWSESQQPGPYRAIVFVNAILCRFSGCTELAFAESRFGPVCEGHTGAVHA